MGDLDRRDGTVQQAGINPTGMCRRVQLASGYLARMNEAMEAGRGRFDDVRDLDAVVRLKAFIEGWPCIGEDGVDQQIPPALQVQLEQMLGRWEQAQGAPGAEAR